MIRHGQTDWNAEGRFQGQHDIPLNAKGRGQAIANGEVMDHVLGGDAAAFDFVASPLGRTRETMERVRTAMGLEPKDYRTDERLVEICFGDWEGNTYSELETRYPEHIAQRSSNKWDFIPPGELAESYEILSWRVGAWLATVNRPTICVSHGGVMRSIFKLVGLSPPEEACDIGIHQDRILKVETDTNSVGWL